MARVSRQVYFSGEDGLKLLARIDWFLCRGGQQDFSEAARRMFSERIEEYEIDTGKEFTEEDYARWLQNRQAEAAKRQAKVKVIKQHEVA